MANSLTEVRTILLPGFDGAALAIHEMGDAGAWPVLLLHGLFSSAEVNWIKYGHAACLAEAGFRVIMPDLRAHGQSSAPHEVSAYPRNVLLKDARAFAAPRWVQQGFRRAHGTTRPGTTMRNLFGQVDGTANPQPGTTAFDEVVWSREGWMAGGTGMVVRRIAMDLDKWDRLDRPGRDQAVGRFQSSGAPLTGTDEFDEPDFAATDAIGFPVIPEFSHVRRSRSDDSAERIFRRGYNYDDAPPTGTVSDVGLLFVSFQADIDRQFVPLQRRLDELDLLNEWTTPIGSAVFAVPPGCAEGGFIGEGILS